MLRPAAVAVTQEEAGAAPRPCTPASRCSAAVFTPRRALASAATCSRRLAQLAPSASLPRAQPRYPVSNPNPDISATVANFSALDYLTIGAFTGASTAFGFYWGARIVLHRCATRPHLIIASVFHPHREPGPRADGQSLHVHGPSRRVLLRLPECQRPSHGPLQISCGGGRKVAILESPPLPLDTPGTGPGRRGTQRRRREAGRPCRT